VSLFCPPALCVCVAFESDLCCVGVLCCVMSWCAVVACSAGASSALSAEHKLSDRELQAVRSEAQYQRKVNELCRHLTAATTALDLEALHKHLLTAASPAYNLKPQFYPQLTTARDTARQLTLLQSDLKQMKAQFEAKEFLKALDTAKHVIVFARKIKLDNADVQFAIKLEADIVSALCPPFPSLCCCSALLCCTLMRLSILLCCVLCAVRCVVCGVSAGAVDSRRRKGGGQLRRQRDGRCGGAGRSAGLHRLHHFHFALRTAHSRRL
jgi:hypothetical protein